MNVLTGLINKVLDMDYVWNDDERIWFIGQRLKCVFCADIKKREIDVVFQLPNLSSKSYREYIQVIKYEDKLICLPSRAKDIVVYNLINHNIITVLIKEYENIDKMWCKSAGILKDKMYILEQIEKRIIIFDINEKKISDVLDIKYVAQDDRIGNQGVVYNNFLYIPVATQQKFVSFDIDTREFKEHFISGNICGLHSMYYSNGYCWIIGEHYGVMRWNPITGDFIEIKNIPDEFKIYIVDTESKNANWYPYSDKKRYNLDSCFCWECLCGEKYIWIIPESANSIIRISTDEMQVRLFRFEEEYQEIDFEYKRDGYEFSAWGIDSSQRLRIITRQKYKVYCIETEDFSYNIEHWKLSKAVIKLVISNLGDKKTWEDDQINLKTLIYGEIEGYLEGKSEVKGIEKGRNIYNSSRSVYSNM